MRTLLDGLGRVARAPYVLAGVWLVSVLVAIGPALMVRASILNHLDASLEAERGLGRVNYDWLQEFMAQADGPAATLTPAVLGFAAVLDNASALFNPRGQPLVVVIAAGLSALAWLFLSAGVIDRYARMRPTGAWGFFGVSGAFLPRFLRLGALALGVQAWLFAVLHPGIADVYDSLVANVTEERTALLIRIGLELPLLLAVAAVQLVFDYARVRAVVEDRRSMLGACLAALRFLSRHGGAAIVVYAANILVLGLVIAAYAIVAPGASAPVWLVLLIGQLYILGRLAARLAFWASATSLFQSRLAHAGYVAAPLPKWPDSASVEAIRRI